ncbi:unnamed protein product [Symbiodinium necroappetens]|uniref:F-box domain-containing protein n=1 Tax=Symbiodinium necroappetens TaxID=1628268 RepID=A0A812U4M7_9DINO|nr:unnamed protein product [Symbiodinium necroappetens]
MHQFLELDKMVQLTILAYLELGELLISTCSSRQQRQRLQDVRQLKITAPSHCNVKLLGLFPSVRTVRALVVRGNPRGEGHHPEPEIAGRLPFALTALPKLSQLLLSDDDSWWHGQESPDFVWDVIVDLTKSLACARQSMLLQGLEWIELCCHSCPQSVLNRQTDRLPAGCSCREIARGFPVATVIHLVANGDLCLGRLELLNIALSRGVDLNSSFPGNPDITLFHHVLTEMTPHDGYPDKEFGEDTDRMCCAIIERMVRAGHARPDQKLLADMASGKFLEDLLDPWTEASLPQCLDYFHDYAASLRAWLTSGQQEPFRWRYPRQV